MVDHVSFHHQNLFVMTAAKSIRLADLDDVRPKASVVYPEFLKPVPTAPATHFSEKTSGKIALPTMEGYHFEKTKHILFLEASGNYTMLHFADGRQILVCKTLREVETMLPTDHFVRIHRSHTIQLRHLKKYIRGKGGYVVLHNGATLAVSAGQKDAFLEVVAAFFG